ncbi:MAG: crosslink repair DNA glycosylase YcaQ family protein [Pseudomonadota bacterium]
MNDFTLGNSAARRVFLDRHALSEAPTGPAKGAALLDLIARLGFVQLDSINTVARAHDLILFARRQRYRPPDLKRLFEKEGALFEHWTHDAAMIPRASYPWWHLRRQRDAQMLRERWKKWRQHEFEHLMDGVLRHIRDTGPCCSADLGGDEPRKSGGWWEWHPSKTALEYLWRSGALTVIGRDGFQKRYDLTERVIDESLRLEAPEEEATIDWCCREAMARLGFATHGELAAFWDHIRPAEAKVWADRALARGELMPVTVIGADGAPRACLARPDLPDDPSLHVPPTSRLRVLSPFDPTLRDRKRAERLFGFDYRIEIFVPEPKRRYGYYVFPVMEGDRIVARVDMKAHRDADVLRVRALWPENGVKWGKGRHAAFEAELDRLTRLASVSTIAFEDDWLRLHAPPKPVG